MDLRLAVPAATAEVQSSSLASLASRSYARVSQRRNLRILCRSEGNQKILVGKEGPKGMVIEWVTALCG